jgi:hypothetical protein
VDDVCATGDDADAGVNCTFSSKSACNYTTEIRTGKVNWQYKSYQTSGQNLPNTDAAGNTYGKFLF